MTQPSPCADVSRAYHEPLPGTASRVRNWLLIEHDGEWGRDPLDEGTLQPSLAHELKRVCDRYKIRPVLIRRTGDRTGAEPAAYAAHSGMTTQWIQGVPTRDVLDIDFAKMREGERPSVGSARDDPMYLVCTHGEHDPCCGRYGRAVADALSHARPGDTWECSHIGGDRFAANLVCLPHGLYFGRVPAASAMDITSLYEKDTIELDHYRGRSCYDPGVQAAEAFIRRRDHLTGVDDLAFASRRDHPRAESTIAFTDPDGGRHEIRIAVRRAEPRRITCHGSGPGSPREYRPVFAAT